MKNIADYKKLVSIVIALVMVLGIFAVGFSESALAAGRGGGEKKAHQQNRVKKSDSSKGEKGFFRDRFKRFNSRIGLVDTNINFASDGGWRSDDWNNAHEDASGYDGSTENYPSSRNNENYQDTSDDESVNTDDSYEENESNQDENSVSNDEDSSYDGSVEESDTETQEDTAEEVDDSGDDSTTITEDPVKTDSDTTKPTLNDNLITNPDFETASGTSIAGWFTGNWGTNKTTFRYPSDGIGGGKAVGVTMESWTDGDAKWYFEDVPVTPGKSYTFSDQYKSTTKSMLTVRYTTSSGGTSYAALGQVLSEASEWTTASKTFTVPAGVTKATVFHSIGGTGSLDIDNASLRLSAIDSSKVFTKGMVSLTFDDNWNSQSVAVPVLNSAGIKGSFYVVTEDISSEQLSLTQIQEIFNAGHEVTAHTRSHPFLVQLDKEKAKIEIEGSRQDLIKAGIAPANTFAYPYGEYNDSVMELTRSAGYVGARGVEEGYNTKDTNRYALLVQNVRNTTTEEEVASWVKTAMETNTWLILVFHQIDETNKDYGTTPERFKSMVDYLAKNKIPTVTVDQGLSMMNAKDVLASNP